METTFNIDLNKSRMQSEFGKTNPNSDSYKDSIEAKDKLKKINGACKTVLKTIATRLLNNDFDYFTEYDNYVEIIKPLDDLGIINKEIPVSEDIFYKNPPSCFIDLAIIVMCIMDFLPLKNTITKENITLDDNKDKAIAGKLFTVYLSFEQLNFDKHSVSVFIPTQNSFASLLCIDNVPILSR